jgi:hypothetical protein
MNANTDRTRPQELSTQSVGQELLILDRGIGMIHRLNETAALIWQKCQAGSSPREVARFLAETYEVEEEAAVRDVSSTLEQLQALNLVGTDRQ